MSKGSSVNFPGPSQAESDLMKEQLDLLHAQRKEIEDFKPFVLKQYGLQEVHGNNPLNQKYADITAKMGQYSPDSPEYESLKAEADKVTADSSWGKDSIVTGYEYTPEQKARNVQLEELQNQALELQKKQGERVKLALEGKLPLSVALLDQRDKDFQAMKEDQLKAGNEIIGDSLDNAVAKTTSGQQGLESLRKVYTLAGDAEQRAVISGEAQLPGVYASLYQGTKGNANPGAPGASYSALAPLYGQAMQPYQFQRSGEFNASQFNANAKNQFTNTLLTGLLNGAAYAGGAAAGK